MLASFLATLVLAVGALNDQSLWFDEFGTWRLTVADSWRDWLEQLVSWPTSDAQIPLYHLYMRAWVHFFPATEMSLRAANLPWLFTGFLALLTTPAPEPSRRLVLVVASAAFLHPMVWYYANEARPYAMMFAGASLAASGLLARLLDPDDRRSTAASNSRLMLGTTMLAATSIIGVLWSVAFLAPAAVTVFRKGRSALNLTGPNRALMVVCGVVLLPTAYQYGVTALRGITATTLHENTIQNFAFGLYEIAGFGGIGPGRDELRAAGASALAPYVVPLFLFAIVVGGTFVAGMLAYARENRKELLLLVLSAAFPLAMLFMLGSVKHWRVVGRHMMPLMLFFSIFLSYGIVEFFRRGGSGFRSIGAKAAAGVPMVALAVSSIQIAHLERHRREDFSGAAQMARQFLRDDDRIWWVAYSLGAEYYKLPLVDVSRCAEAGTQSPIWLDSPQRAALDSCREPQIIILGRPDTSDRTGAVRQYALDRKFRQIGRLRGFEILGK